MTVLSAFIQRATGIPLADIPAAIARLTAAGSWSKSLGSPPQAKGSRSIMGSYHQVHLRGGTSQVRTPKIGVSPNDPSSAASHSSER